MKVMTILGTRPEIIRLSRLIPRLDKSCEHVLVHTGQNFDRNLSAVFFEELGLREPDHYCDVKADSMGEQIANIIQRCERILRKEKPDRLLLLGDTNSALSSFVAKRMDIKVYHMEAGNRCYDDRVPEEVNRRVIDHASDVLMPYTERSRANLLREGIPGERIYVTGNPIFEVIRHAEARTKASTILKDLDLEAGQYFLVTLHREENVDEEGRLRSFTEAFQAIHREHGLPIVCSLHPRTRKRMEKHGISASGDGLRFLEPFGFFDFIHLEQNAKCVLSDSGTVQEECCLLRVPSVTLRDVTERPETLECGSNILSGGGTEDIARCVQVALGQSCQWKIPKEYLEEHVSEIVERIVLGYRPHYA